jgi:hypothetical protein
MNTETRYCTYLISHIKKDGYVACHVRRGDYVQLRNKHPEVKVEWYEKVMANFLIQV